MLPLPAGFARKQICGARRRHRGDASNPSGVRCGSAYFAGVRAKCRRPVRTRRGRGASRCPRRDRSGRTGHGRSRPVSAGEAAAALHGAGQPLGNGVRGRKARVVEIVAPSEVRRSSIAEPAVEAEWRKIHRFELFDQAALLRLAIVFAIARPGDYRRIEQAGSCRRTVQRAATACSSGASWWYVHCFGSLSGRQRTNRRAVAKAAAGDLVIANLDDQLWALAAPMRIFARCSSGSGRPAHCR